MNLSRKCYGGYTSKFRYAECRSGGCRSVECRYAECHYAECHYAECHYAECHYAECRGLSQEANMEAISRNLIE